MSEQCVVVQRVGEHNLKAPSRGSEGAAGYDLRCLSDYKIWPGQSALIRTGFRFAIPEGYVGLIRDRSGLAVRSRLTTRAGVIDSDYRGEVMVALVNEGESPVDIERGERIAQILFLPVGLFGMDLEEGVVGETERGEGGFGSSGRL